MPTTDYLPVATSGGANVDTQANFAGSSYQLDGFVNGIALPAQANKIWHQSSMIAAGIANYLMNTLGIDIPDDGNLSNLIGWMTTAFTSAPPSLSMSENLAGSSRFFGTAYTASTAPLIVTISGYATSEGTLVVSVGGLSIPAIQTSAAGERGDATITFAVPKGTAYSAVGSNGTGATLNLSTWIETQLL